MDKSLFCEPRDRGLFCHQEAQAYPNPAIYADSSILVV